MYEELDKANAFNDYFAEQTKLQADASSEPTPPLYQLNSTLSNIHPTHHELELILRSLPLGKAVGPDLVNNRILKELAFELSISHSKLFNYSLLTLILPSCWKLANVCPVHKKDSQSIVSNYRLISLLSTISKDFERVVYKHVFNHHRDNNLFTEHQSGFLPHDSTVCQLSYLYHTFCEAIDQGKEIRVIVCDVSKAFDRVWHRGLILK